MGGFGGLGDAHLDDVADLWLPRLLSVKGRVSPSYLINAGSILGGGGWWWWCACIAVMFLK